MRQDDKILPAVRTVLVNVLSVDPASIPLATDTPLLGAIPEMDSQAVLFVIMGLEEKFDLEFDDEEIDADVFRTLGNLTSLVSSKVAQR